MSVGFRSGAIWTEVGESDFLHAFFSTICFHLESNKWGSKYPYLQKKLYYDALDSKEAIYALEELKEIQMKFTALKPEDTVWDCEDLTKKPPKEFFANKNASSLAECFITVGKKNLISRLAEILEFCIKRGISVKIQREIDLIK